MMIDNLTLTPKQQRFCDEYLIDMNATKAALRAGYSGSTALSGSLMTIPKVKLYLQQRTTEVAQKIQVSHEMILSELAKVAFGNIGNCFLPDGGMKPMHQLTNDEKAAIASITVKEFKASADAAAGVITRIKMNNKMSALDKIAKHLKFYDADAKQPEVVYVYVDKDNLDDYDRFDDDSFDDDEEEEEEEYEEEEEIAEVVVEPLVEQTYKTRQEEIEAVLATITKERAEEQAAMPMPVYKETSAPEVTRPVLALDSLRMALKRKF